MRILTNALFVSPPLAYETFDSIAIDDGKIIAIGSLDELLSRSSDKNKVEDLDGLFVLPGFCDSHIHLLEYGNFLNKIDCETPTRQDCIQRIIKKCESTQPGKWILGHGWNHNVWPEGIGNATILDHVTQLHPIYLTSKSLHCSWVNSAALNLAGINVSTPNPSGGYIERDLEGNPTGILYESASCIVQNVIPKQSLEENISSIASAQARLLSFGITSVHDFDSWECYDALKEMENQGQLFLQVSKGIPYETFQISIDSGLQSGKGSDLLKIGPLKLFCDGALGSQTASLLQPYQGSQSTGMLLLESQEIFEIGIQAVSHGVDMAIHAIGDKANRMVLDAFEKIRTYEKEKGFVAGNHRIEHVQLIHPSDQKRMATLNIVASMQPIHASSDREMADKYWGKRCKYAYAWQSLSKAGVRIIFGSDAPVENPNPFLGIYSSLTRKNLNQRNKPGWYPDQCLNLDQALNAYTQGMTFTKKEIGSQSYFKTGDSANMVFFNKNPRTLQPEELLKLRPIMVMSRGDWVKT